MIRVYFLHFPQILPTHFVFLVMFYTFIDFPCQLGFSVCCSRFRITTTTKRNQDLVAPHLLFLFPPQSKLYFHIGRLDIMMVVAFVGFRHTWILVSEFQWKEDCLFSPVDLAKVHGWSWLALLWSCALLSNQNGRDWGKK